MLCVLLSRNSAFHGRTGDIDAFAARGCNLTTMKLALAFLSASLLSSAAATPHWVATWAASPSPQPQTEAETRAAHFEFANQTLREIVHISLGGKTVRLRVSNVFGKENLTLAGVHVAVAGKESAIEPGTDQGLTFNGRASVTIPANAVVFSDPLAFEAKADSNLAITLFVPGSALGAGIHYSAEQTSYIGAGDQLAADKIANPQTIESWLFLAGLDVQAPAKAAAIVTFGDSITDGARSTLNANHRWPNYLATRLLDRKGHNRMAVVDAGIGGNRILHDAQGAIRFGVNALARFDRDVLSEPGVKYVVLMEGINDLGHAGTSAPLSETVTADDLIAGMQQLIERCHERGVKIFGATLTPFEGTVYPGYFSAEKELKRKALNEWIRNSHAFDGVIDFDAALRDPQHPDRMRADYESDDHLHPRDAGYKAMADAVDLKLFR